ncbi:hypothetical protein [Lacipirellula limnantheis]|nr:hypothetical protein [Lacipirellula limnantheis]
MTSTMLRFISPAATLLVVVCGGPCCADVVTFNNFGSNPIYQPAGTWQGSAEGGSEETMLAQRFTAKFGGRLAKIESGMTFNFPSQGSDPNNVDYLSISLVPDDSNKPGSQVFWSQNYINNVPITVGAIASFDVQAGPTLKAGSKYWVVSRSTSIGTTPYVWWLANPPASEPYAYYYFKSIAAVTGEWISGNTPPHRRHEFSLRVTVIPEPAAAALMLAASATLLAICRRTIL